MTADIVDLLSSKGLVLKKKTANEYATACPFCGGKDRFCVWPAENRYWCRQCQKKGDAIQFLRDLEGLDFRSAKEALGMNVVIPMNKAQEKTPKPAKNESGAKRRIVATYDYKDYDGNLAFQVVRFDPKDFRQRRPGKTKDWIWDLKGVGLVLYRLEDVLKSDYVFFCEGEKDVDTLRRLGLVATCNPMGAGKIKSQHDNHEILGPLQDRKVYVIADNDPPGKQHALDIANILDGFSSEVKIIDLPVDMSGDVSDFINDLGPDMAMKALRELVAKTDRFRRKSEFIDVEELNGIEFPKSSNLIGNGVLIDRGQLIIAGEGGIGKSILRLEMAIHLAMGMDWLGLPIPSAKKVLICQYENGQQTEQSRLRLMMMGLGISRIPPKNLVWLKQSRDNRPDMTKVGDVKRMLEIIAEKRPDVVIWDCLSNIHSANENDNVKMRNVLDNITDIATDLCHAVILIHHFGKPAENEQQARHRFRGASSILDWATCAFALTRQSDPDRCILKLTNVKMRDAAELKPIFIERNKHFCSLLTTESGLVTTKTIMDSITAAGNKLKKSELYSLLEENTGCSYNTARNAVKDAIEFGHIWESKEGRARYVRVHVK